MVSTPYPSPRLIVKLESRIQFTKFPNRGALFIYLFRPLPSRGLWSEGRVSLLAELLGNENNGRQAFCHLPSTLGVA